MEASSNQPGTSSASERQRELDEITVRRAQRGEQDACRALVLCYQNQVFALLSRMLGPGRRTLVEDLAQETFLHVFRALATFAPLGPARLSTWILTIASRRAIDELRKHPAGVTLMPLDSDAVSVLGAHGPMPPPRADEATRRRQLAAAIQRAIADLEPPYRAAFLLREYHDMEYAEIARALSIDIGTVKSRLARARAALREALTEIRDASF